MGEPIIINDGSPVKISWHGEHGWIADQEGLSLTREGNLQLRWIMFNLDLFGKVEVDGQLQMKINFKLKSEKTGQTLLVTTDANGRNIRLAIADPKGKKFSDFFAAPPGVRKTGKLQTPKDASITGISYQIGNRQPQKARTLKLLPTSIYLEVAGENE
jgi:hypothetical protein